MRRWIAGILIMMLTMSSAAPAARAQSTPLIGGGLNAWTPSDVISGTNDWQRVEIGPIVVDADRTAALMLEMYNGPGGTVWFDDVTLTKLSASGVEVFLLYPNFRGMLFDDGPSTL